MPSVRFWNGSRLVVGWVVSTALFVVVRWGLQRGVVREALGENGIERLGGLWSQEFATLVTLLVAGLLAGTLVWTTASWIAGRRERAVMRRHHAPAQRRILM
jgi:hypothetical protein